MMRTTIELFLFTVVFPVVGGWAVVTLVKFNYRKWWSERPKLKDYK